MLDPNLEQLKASFAAPAEDAAAIAPSDTTDLSPAPRAIYVGTGGTIVIDTPSSTTLTFKNFPSGQILPVRAKRVRNTNTTAADMIALY